VCSEKHRVAAESLLFQEMNTVELQWKDMSRLEVRCSPPRPLAHEVVFTIYGGMQTVISVASGDFHGEGHISPLIIERNYWVIMR